MQKAITLDQAEIKNIPSNDTEDIEYSYPDNDEEHQASVASKQKEDKAKSAISNAAEKLKKTVTNTAKEADAESNNQTFDLSKICKLDKDGVRSKENMIALRDYFEKTRNINRDDIINVANNMLGYDFKDFEDLCRHADESCINMLANYF
jgi:hypothetical protein